MKKEELRDILALISIPKLGPKTAKNLIAYCGGVSAIFNEKARNLQKIPGIGPKIATEIKKGPDFKLIDKELEFIDKKGIQPFYFLNDNYPARLKDIPDSPIMLFYKGNADLNASKILGIVGTRKSTDYGRSICDQIIEDLKPYNVIIVSGLAYGIDAAAHQASVRKEVPTVGVLGHGLDQIYPSSHRSLVGKILSNGGLLTEYFSGTKPDRENFPARNRIVAGIIDGLVVVESGLSGGALITAEMANSYNREVLAFPGRTNDEFSLGCNHLIKTNKACLVENAADIAYQMGWDLMQKKAPKILSYTNLPKPQIQLVDIMRGRDRVGLDSICHETGISLSELSLLLLDLEFKGIVQALPR